MPLIAKARLESVLPVVIILLILSEFVVDLQTPLGFADWMSYVVPILLTGWMRKPWTKSVVGIVSVLAIVGVFLSPPGPTHRMDISLINRAIGIIVFWITAVLVILRKNALEKLRHAHIELEHRTEKMMRMEKLKAEFLADTSHELRTPLAVVKSHLDLALGKKSKKVTDPHRALKEIDKEMRHISQVVTDIALLARSDSGFRHSLNFSTFPLQKLIADVIRKHKILAKNKNISIAVQFPSQLNCRGDKEKLERLFTNLLANAIQYGREGGHINVSGSEDDQWITTTIEDDGIGISKKDLSHIFDRFYRVDKMRNRGFGGVGLGLAICKQIAEINGGTIEATSTYQKGSTFTVKLPSSGKVRSQ